MLENQDLNYIDKDITNVFHFLELKEQHNFLIGSNNIRNILYSNDYDLNSNISSPTSILYKEFLHIFDVAYKTPEYYILDFKCGVDPDGEPIRWSYDDLKHNKTRFEECLLMENNTIKLDMCYIYNEIFTDINCLYILHHVQSKNDVKKVKESESKTIANQLKSEIKELRKNKQHYKALKRLFSLGLVTGKCNKKILAIMNSDLGMFYKFISFLKLVIEMLDQNFKPVPMSLVKSNLEYIKQFASHITEIKIDSELNQLIKIISCISKLKMKPQLETLVFDCSKKLNDLI